MSSPVRVVGAVFYNDTPQPPDGMARYLAFRRRPGKSMAGLWEFPGGKIESGESPEAALSREIQEELGIAIDIERHLLTYVCGYDFGDVELSTYLCRADKDTFQLTDHDATKWVTHEQARELDWALADIPTVEYLRGILR